MVHKLLSMKILSRGSLVLTNICKATLLDQVLLLIWLSKLRNQKFLKLTTTTITEEEVILWSNQSKQGQRFKFYVVFIIFFFFRNSWFYLLRSKSDFYSIFVKFQALVENQLQRKIGIFQSDGGGKFINLKLISHLENSGIQHLVSSPHTPQQNGLTERKHRHLIELGLSMLF